MILAIVIAVIIISVSGQYSKPYKHLSSEEKVMLAGALQRLDSIAREYAPRISADRAEDLPDQVLYEAYSDGDSLRVAYFYGWPAEKHPNRFIHYMYLPWRMLYYGSARDIEYVDVEIGIEDGRVRNIRFEKPAPGAMGIIMRHEKVDVVVEGALAPGLKVSSWNHLFEVSEEGAEGISLEASPEYLDDITFRKYRIVRRSMPDWMTEQ